MCIFSRFLTQFQVFGDCQLGVDGRRRRMVLALREEHDSPIYDRFATYCMYLHYLSLSYIYIYCIKLYL